MKGLITCLQQNYCYNGKHSYGSQSMLYCNLQSFWQTKHRIIRMGIFWCSGDLKRHWQCFSCICFQEEENLPETYRKETDFFSSRYKKSLNKAAVSNVAAPLFYNLEQKKRHKFHELSARRTGTRVLLVQKECPPRKPPTHLRSSHRPGTHLFKLFKIHMAILKASV